MPIFVTGGTGLLGVNLVRQLVGRGYEVAPIDQAITDAINWFVEHGFMKRAAIRPVPSGES